MNVNVNVNVFIRTFLHTEGHRTRLLLNPDLFRDDMLNPDLASPG